MGWSRRLQWLRWWSRRWHVCIPLLGWRRRRRSDETLCRDVCRRKHGRFWHGCRQRTRNTWHERIRRWDRWWYGRRYGWLVIYLWRRGREHRRHEQGHGRCGRGHGRHESLRCAAKPVEEERPWRLERGRNAASRQRGACARACKSASA